MATLLWLGSTSSKILCGLGVPSPSYPERNNLDRSLTIRENLLFHANYHGVPQRVRDQRATELLEQFGLADRSSEKVEMFSGGQTQRIMIARALTHSPEVLFLDEPSTGLDPAARLFVWDRIRELQERNVTVVLTTHDMDEASQLSGRVGIMDHGHLLALDTPEALTRSLPGSSTLDVAAAGVPPESTSELLEALAALPSVERADPVDDRANAAAADERRAAYGGERKRGIRRGIGVPHLLGTRDPRAPLCDRRRGVLGGAGGSPAQQPPGIPHRRSPGQPEPRGRLHPPDREVPALTSTPSSAAGSAEAGRAGQPEAHDSPERQKASVRPGRAFVAVLGRDLFVTGRELPIFLAQVILQPFFFLFVFGRVLSELGYTTSVYSHLLFPGIVALTAFLTSLQTTALPLVFDFSYTKEIEDRLLAPMPVSWVALEKLVFAGIRSLIAAVMMFPIGILVLGSIPWRAAGAPLFIVVLLLGTLAGATLGLTLGTLVDANRINIVFTLVLTPILFTGCSQYPWPSLYKLKWFQWLTTLNPLTYVSEGMRAALVPSVPHIRSWVCILMLVVSLIVFGTIGVKGFLRRAID